MVSVGSAAVYIPKTNSKHLSPFSPTVKGALAKSAELQNLGEMDSLDSWLNMVD